MCAEAAWLATVQSTHHHEVIAMFQLSQLRSEKRFQYIFLVRRQYMHRTVVRGYSLLVYELDLCAAVCAARHMPMYGCDCDCYRVTVVCVCVCAECATKTRFVSAERVN